jgi:hypothetical protein
VRHVHKCKVQGTGKWEIIEHFLEFKDFARKTGSDISEMILSALEGHGIDVVKAMIMVQICQGKCR